MYIDPTVYQGRPSDDRIPQELAVYDKLEELGISFTRVDHDHADTMEDCLLIERTLGARICKNLFLCNRQQTDFYLLMMPGDKPFKTKDLSRCWAAPDSLLPARSIWSACCAPSPAR